MRTDTGSDFCTKLKSSNYSVREITDATGKASSDLNFNVDCYGNQLAIGQLGSGWDSARQRRRTPCWGKGLQRRDALQAKPPC